MGLRTQAKSAEGVMPEPLRAGLYQFNYWPVGADDGAKGRGLAVLRCGSVLGSDEWGGVFTGTYRASEARGGHHDVRVRFRLPPFGELVTGLAAGPEGLDLEITCTFARPDPKALAHVDVGGVPVALELVYIGAVPTT